MGYINEKDIKQFEDLGYIITEPALEPELVANISAEFARLQKENLANLEQTGNADEIELAKTRPFIGQTHQKSKVLFEATQHPVYQEACAKLMSPDSDLYYNQAVVKPPEKGRSFAWHQDTGYGYTNPEWYLTCWTAITEATLENGCVWIVPESHKGGLLDHTQLDHGEGWAIQVDEEKAIPVEVKPGQVVIFNSLLFHKSTANTSKTVREAFVPQYHFASAVDREGNKVGDHVPLLRDGKFTEAKFEDYQEVVSA